MRPASEASLEAKEAQWKAEREHWEEQEAEWKAEKQELIAENEMLQAYWQRAVKVVKEAHSAYLSQGPLQRHEVRPAQPDALVCDASEAIVFYSIEMRLRSLLLNVIPETSKSMCLSTEQPSTTDILFVVGVEA